MIIVRLSDQTLIHRRRTGTSQKYSISTAMKGAGNFSGSEQTPLGRHRIFAKIGEDWPINTAFAGRLPVGIYNPETCNPDKDWILSRILWLEGTDTRLNKFGRKDTLPRYIYIHGTHEEEKLGTPVSHGCIRMANEDILDLFDEAAIGESVHIQI